MSSEGTIGEGQYELRGDCWRRTGDKNEDNFVAVRGWCGPLGKRGRTAWACTGRQESTLGLGVVAIYGAEMQGLGLRLALS